MYFKFLFFSFGCFVSSTLYTPNILHMNRFNFFLPVVLAGILASCVSSQQYKSLNEKQVKCMEERDNLLAENDRLLTENRELKATSAYTKQRLELLLADSAEIHNEIARATNENAMLSQRYNNLLESQKALLEGNQAEVRKLLTQLQEAEQSLSDKGQDLQKLDRALSEKKANLDKLQSELNDRNKRLEELQRILARKDSVTNALRTKVSAALLGFEGQGLNVYQKNGKVYVSLDEQLLFKTGSTAVDPKGVNALKKLAGVLEANADINVMIEGHTDDVKVLAGSAYKDNWDLSVQRATSIVRILLDGTSIDPKRLTASGRGEFLPVDAAKNADARRKNRRTEIILTPKLDELLKVLDAN